MWFLLTWFWGLFIDGGWIALAIFLIVNIIFQLRCIYGPMPEVREPTFEDQIIRRGSAGRMPSPRAPWDS